MNPNIQLLLSYIGDVNYLKTLTLRDVYYQIINIVMLVMSALMVWKGLILYSNSESPLVVVISGSMEPAYFRGDILYVTNRVEEPYRVGEVIVFKVSNYEIPIIHRIIAVHQSNNGSYKILTKGDNNQIPDHGLYPEGKFWLTEKDILGRSQAYYPYVGYFTLFMHDYPKAKYGLFGYGILYLLTNRT